MFTADNDSTLICLPLHQAISSFQSNVVKWQVTKGCSRDSSNIPQKVHNEESILPIFLKDAYLSLDTYLEFYIEILVTLCPKRLERANCEFSSSPNRRH